MNYRLKTSEEAKIILEDLRDRTNITPNILARYAISLSIKDSKPLNINKNLNHRGQEFHRQILTGKYDLLFKTLITHKEQKPISDDEYFNLYLPAHLERGIFKLQSEYQINKRKEKFLSAISKYGLNGGSI